MLIYMLKHQDTKTWATSSSHIDYGKFTMRIAKGNLYDSKSVMVSIASVAGCVCFASLLYLYDI